MGYLHIGNLYRDQRILQFREVYALEKIHGTSAHVSWRKGELRFFSGGEKHDRFVALFDHAKLAELFLAIGLDPVTVYGEAYGGKQQGQSERYGKELRFVAFDVQVNESWLEVPSAADFVSKLGIEFVHYVKIPAELYAIDRERDAPSEQAKRNGIAGPQIREGVVPRPPFEVRCNNGERIISKHKRDEFKETATPRRVADPAKLETLQAAEAIADEWVTPMRLAHILDKLGDVNIEQTRDVISAMTEDVLREAAGEIVDSKEARAAIGKKTVALFKARLRAALETKETE